jgi:hypothetical protein
MAQIVVLKRAHFFGIDNDIIDVYARDIGGKALAVYTVLCRYANRTTGECWPSIKKIAFLLDFARNTVKAALRTLEAAGLIAIRRRRDPAGDPASHLYTLLDPTPQAVETRRRRKAEERGRSADAPPPPAGVDQPMTYPWSADDPPGRSPCDPEPDLLLEPEEMNQVVLADATEETPPPQAANACPHPKEGRVILRGLGGFCFQCKRPFPDHLIFEDHLETAEEDQAHAAGVA